MKSKIKMNLETLNCILLGVIAIIVLVMVVRRVREKFVIEYSPLPCDVNGNTNWDSDKQVGHETCVDYGTEGASNDIRASSLGVGKLSDLDMGNTVKSHGKSVEEIEQMIITNSSGNIIGVDGRTFPAASNTKKMKVALDLYLERCTTRGDCDEKVVEGLGGSVDDIIYPTTTV